MEEASQSFEYIDLRGTPCPKNYIKCCLALENMSSTQILQVDIDRGEPESMVIPGLRAAGHQVEIICTDLISVRLSITCGTT